MDEILIEEKKYVSSKRAAKITGYAKDYIGQLCREGRVPARLVGRSWYVLESAIQDHRFGNEGIVSKPPVEEKKVSKKTISETWESPRYETQERVNSTIPPINRVEEDKAQEEISKDLHDSWKSWFAHFENSVPEADLAPAVTTDLVVGSEDFVDAGKELSEGTEEESIDVPIHIMGQKYPPKELLPRKIDDKELDQDAILERKDVSQGDGTNTSLKMRIAGAIYVTSILIAVSLTTLSIISSGYFDTLLLSFKQASYITGISVYSK